LPNSLVLTTFLKRIAVSTIPERIKQFNSSRLHDYTALKYELMAENPFRFFRGTCHLFYEDLHQHNSLPLSPIAWISGDLHLENFGTYKGDNRLVYFDLNDFDEGMLAPAAWEVVRMVTSIFTGCESLGIKDKDALQLAQLFLRAYASTLDKGKARYLEIETANGIVKLFMEKISQRKQKELIRQRTEERKGDKLRFRIDKVRLFPIDKTLRKELMTHIGRWLEAHPMVKGRFRILDACFRVAGTGSLGCRRYVFLIRNADDPKKHALIDMKEALPSSLQPWLTIPQPHWISEAERVVAIQKRMQNVSPALLGTTLFQDHPFVVKEMQPIADKIDFLLVRDRFRDIACVVEDMAFMTASAQLRSASRQGAAGPDDLIAFGQDTHWQQPLLDYAKAYAGQVQKDYQDYFTAYKAGYFS
jgi:uncharacterized protein (DUF2252 family)